jgi:hypothetical protein
MEDKKEEKKEEKKTSQMEYGGNVSKQVTEKPAEAIPTIQTN